MVGRTVSRKVVELDMRQQIPLVVILKHVRVTLSTIEKVHLKQTAPCELLSVTALVLNERKQ